MKKSAKLSEISPFTGTIHIEKGIITSLEKGEKGVDIVIDGTRHSFSRGYALPGMIEAHAHVSGVGEKLSALALYDARSAEECVQRAAAFDGRLGVWLTGLGWNQELWTEKVLPHKTLLDKHFPDTPVYLRRADGHAAWCNSAALALCGIDNLTPNPEGGTFVRDEEGELTGVVVDNAMLPFMKAMPSPTETELRSFIATALEHYASLGVTEIYDMDVPPDVVALFQKLDEEGNLPLRLHSFVSGQEEQWLHANMSPTFGKMHRCDFVKMFADGALGSRGALLWEEYSDATTRGLELLDVSTMLRQCRRALERGWNIGIHAIGDAANSNVLEVFATLREDSDAPPERLLRIEHAQMVRPHELPLFAKYDIGVAVQAIHCTSDADMAVERLGEARCAYSYPWRSLAENNVEFMGSSDAPIEPADPLTGIDAFVRRQPRSHSSAWFGQECLTRSEALASYINAAHIYTGTYSQRGSIEVGKQADIAVWDTDLLHCSDDDLLSAKVLSTYCNGRQIYINASN